MADRQEFPQGDFDHDACQHRTEIVLDGRRICTEGCGKDLGPA